MASGDVPRGFPIRILPIVIALIAGVFIVARGCQVGPFGRMQVVGLTPDQESRLGLQTFEHILQESEVVQGGAVADVVRHLGERLAQSSVSEEVVQRLRLRTQTFNWDFRVVRSGQVNAFCLPGGKVVVYTGIFPVAENEAGLATVMGHEIGHALAHHGAERMAQEQLVQLGQAAVAESLDRLDAGQRQQLFAVLGVGSRVGILLPFSRKHESEADHIGLILMAAAGYDPRESVKFWQRMEQTVGAKHAEFMSTHPGHEHRAHDLEGWLGEALPLYEKSDQQKNRRFSHKN